MAQTVIGVTNLDKKRRIKAIQPSTQFPGRFVAVDQNGGYIFIDPNGTILTGGQTEGAYQVCRKVGQTLVFQYGTLSFSEDELD
jgi:hypothetical protein